MRIELHPKTISKYIFVIWLILEEISERNKLEHFCTLISIFKNSLFWNLHFSIRREKIRDFYKQILRTYNFSYLLYIKFNCEVSDHSSIFNQILNKYFYELWFSNLSRPIEFNGMFLFMLLLKRVLKIFKVNMWYVYDHIKNFVIKNFLT